MRRGARGGALASRNGPTALVVVATEGQIWLPRSSGVEGWRRFCLRYRVCWAASTTVALLITALLAVPVNAQRGREDGCKSEEIKAAGKASIFGKAAAMRNAIDNWQRE